MRHLFFRLRIASALVAFLAAMTLGVSPCLAQSSVQERQTEAAEAKALAGAVHRLVQSIIWPDRVFHRKEDRIHFTIGVETDDRTGTALSRLGGKPYSPGRVYQVNLAPLTLAAEDLQRFEIIVASTPATAASYRNGTENGTGATIIVGTFNGAIEAGCAVELVKRSGNYGYRVNLAELKSRGVEASAEFMAHYAEEALRRRIPLERAD